MREIKEIVERYLSKAEKVSEYDLSSSYMNLRKAVEAVANDLDTAHTEKFISVMRKLKNLRNSGKITEGDCSGLIKIVEETNPHCHDSPLNNTKKFDFNQLVTKFSDIFFNIYDEYVSISDDTDVSLFNKESIQKTKVYITTNSDYSNIENDLLMDVMNDAEICRLNHEYEMAESLAIFCLDGFRHIKNEIYECKCNIMLSQIYEGQGDLVRSFDFAQQGLAYAREINLRREEIEALHTLGIVHEKNGDFLRSRPCLNRAIEMALESNYDNFSLAKIQNSLAMSYLDYPQSRDLEKAEILLNDALNNIGDRDDPPTRGSILACFSFIEEKKGNFREALGLAYEARVQYQDRSVHPSWLEKLNAKITILENAVRQIRTKK